MPPSYFDPCLPVLARAPPKGSDWVHQPKWDGYRCLIAKIGQRVRLYSRNGTEWSDRLPGLVEAFAALRTDFILDGELCLCDDRGRPIFRALHAEMRQRRLDTSRMAFFAFDLSFEHDVDLRPLPVVGTPARSGPFVEQVAQGGTVPVPGRKLSGRHPDARTVRPLCHPCRSHPTVAGTGIGPTE